MKLFILSIAVLVSLQTAAQKQSYDIVTFSAPKGWKKSALSNATTYSVTDKAKNTWAQIIIVKSTASKGTIDADFVNEWEELVAKPYNAGQPLATDTVSIPGWKMASGLSQFEFKGDTAAVLLNTMSNGERCVSYIILTNSTDYNEKIEAFAASFTLPAPEQKKITTPESKVSTPAISTGFQFNTTNFDDGWTSVVKENWVEATKGNITVLLHYPTAEYSTYYPRQDERMTLFWNMLVAPRYSNLRDYSAPSSNLAEAAYFASGMLTDNATGKDVWVTLFDKGKSGWIEIITPDKNTFVKTFGVDNPHSFYTEWDALVNLKGLNRFAVGEKDLEGKWSNDFTSSGYYYNVYTGIYAGSSTYASVQTFTFGANKTYNWHLVTAAGGMGSSMKVDQTRAAGSWKLLNNWQIWFSEIEKRPKTYNAYFSCIKGARILWLQDTEYGSYTSYGKVTK